MESSLSEMANILLCNDAVNEFINTNITLAETNRAMLRIDAQPSNSVSCEIVIIIFLE